MAMRPHFMLGCGTRKDIGSRSYQEDEVLVLTDLNPLCPGLDQTVRRQVAAVFDGHGGRQACSYVQQNLHRNVCAQPSFLAGDVKQALKDGFTQTDRDWLAIAVSDGVLDKSGCCVCMALFIGDTVYIANVGDCRAVLFSKKRVVHQLSRDHKPDDSIERSRIEAAGGSVDRKVVFRDPVCCFPARAVATGRWRVQPGRLAVARTIGTITCKLPQYGGKSGTVISVPDITTHELSASDEFLVLGTDGIWDNITKNSELYSTASASILSAHARRESRATAAAAAVVEYSKHACRVPSAQDNLTAVVVTVKRPTTEAPGASTA